MKDNKEQILKAAYQNEDDYWMLPSQGLMADWFLRYWEMHNLVLEHFGEEPYPTPINERRKYDAEKRSNQ